MRKRMISALLVCLMFALLAIPAQAAESVKYGRYPNAESKMFVTDGAYFYYMVFSTEKEPYRIMKQAVDGSSKTVIHTGGDFQISNLNLMDGWIYFSAQDKVYRIRTDGTGLTLLHSARVSASSDYSITIWDMLVVNDKLYVQYSDYAIELKHKLISMDLDGANPQTIYESATSFGSSMTVYNKQIFLLSQDSLTVTCYDIEEDTVKTFVLEDARMRAGNYYLQVSSEGRLYFYSAPADYGDTSSAAYSFNPDGSDVQQETAYSRYIIVDDTIFYYDSLDGNIYQTLLDGSGTPIKITSSKIRGFFTYHNGYLYTYSFVEKEGVEEQEVNTYKVNASTTTSQSSGTKTAAPATSKVVVNGTDTSFDAYTIDQNNYFKLRDLATVLSGTEKQFEVTWDSDNNAIYLVSNKAYTPVGGEMAKSDSTSKTAQANTSAIYLNGESIALTAYTINGTNYFKLRDIGKTFDFDVTWDGTNNTIVIDTSKGYTED